MLDLSEGDGCDTPTSRNPRWIGLLLSSATCIGALAVAMTSLEGGTTHAAALASLLAIGIGLLAAALLK